MYNNSTLSNREKKLLLPLDKMNRYYSEHSSHAVEQEEYEHRHSLSYYEGDFANGGVLLNDPSQRHEANYGSSYNDTDESKLYQIRQVQSSRIAKDRRNLGYSREGSDNSVYRSIYHHHRQDQDDYGTQFSYVSNKNSAITIVFYVLLLSIASFGFLIKEMIQEYDNVSAIDESV